MEITEKSVPGYERVIFGIDRSSGYHGIIVIHSTALGPAVGGTRSWRYPNSDAALTDGLRLARGMTYKNALADVPFGGGKSIVMDNGDSGDNGNAVRRADLFRAHGRLVESLAGKYITAEDVGTSPADMELVLQETQHVAGLQGRSGDPSPRTARGVFRAMQAAAKHRWGSNDLSRKTVAVQGCGHVGYHLGSELHRAGAALIVTDMDQERVKRMVMDYGATSVPLEDIYCGPADIFAPCAMGGVINDQTIPRLTAEMVVGAANNQLLEPRHGDLLEQRGILYAPDYAANAGGIINGCCIEMMGWKPERTAQKLEGIYDTMLKIFEIAAREHIPTYQAADHLAEQRLAGAKHLAHASEAKG